MKNCIQCDKHIIINDPDPGDWFCDDDMAVVCSLAPNPNINPVSTHMSERHEFKSIAVAIRPYNMEKEALIPDWCPLK